jgi:hypothetical protein
MLSTFHFSFFAIVLALLVIVGHILMILIISTIC